jgi:hypothetical protein
VRLGRGIGKTANSALTKEHKKRKAQGVKSRMWGQNGMVPSGVAQFVGTIKPVAGYTLFTKNDFPQAVKKK